MKREKLFFIFVCLGISILCYGEEATGNYYKDIVFKNGRATVIIPMPDNKGYFVSFDNGSVCEADTEMNIQKEIYKANSGIVALACTHQYLAVATKDDITRLDKKYYGWKTSPIRFGSFSRPITTIAFSTDPYDTYLFVVDIDGKSRILMNNDRKESNSGDGSYIDAIFDRDTTINHMIHNGNELIFFGTQIRSYEWEWNVAESKNDQTIQAEKPPELKSKTGKVLVDQNAVCGALEPNRQVLYYVIRRKDKDQVMKHEIGSKKHTLFYESAERIQSVAADGINVFLIRGGKLTVVRNEYVDILIHNLAEVPVDLSINDIHQGKLTPGAKKTFVRKPGTYSVSASNYAANIFVEAPPEASNGKINLKHTQIAEFTIHQEHPIRLFANSENRLEPRKAQLNGDGSLIAVLYKRKNRSVLFVINIQNRKVLYPLELDSENENIQILFCSGKYADYLIVADSSRVTFYSAKTGEKVFDTSLSEGVKLLTASPNGRLILAMGENSINCIDITKRASVFQLDGVDFSSVRFIEEEVFVTADHRSNCIYQIRHENPVPFHWIPTAWAGSPTTIIPVGDGSAFATLDNKNILRRWNGSRDQVEPDEILQFDESLNYLFDLKKNNIVYLAFENTNRKRIEFYELLSPEKTSMYTETGTRLTFATANGNVVLASDENSNIISYNAQYNSYNRVGIYVFFEENHGIFLMPATGRAHDRYIYCTPAFLRNNIWVQQGAEKREFSEQDEKKLQGG